MLIGQNLPFTAHSLVHDNLFWLKKPFKKKGSNKLTSVNSAFRTNVDPVSPLIVMFREFGKGTMTAK